MTAPAHLPPASWETPGGFEFHGHIEGYLAEDEARLLYTLAMRTHRDGRIVELGCYKGRSTMHLAQAGRKMWVADHFSPSTDSAPVLDDGEDDPVHADHRAGTYYTDFIRNMASLEFQTPYRLYTATGAQAAALYRADEGDEPSIDLLFIDSDHTYAAVKAEWEAWAPLIRPGGRVALHDADLPDVDRVIYEALDTEEWKLAEMANLITVLIKENHGDEETD